MHICLYDTAVACAPRLVVCVCVCAHVCVCHAGDEFGALLQYLELAEQGSAAAQANAAWLLRHGKGYTGPGYLDLASQLYERYVNVTHTRTHTRT